MYACSHDLVGTSVLSKNGLWRKTISGKGAMRYLCRVGDRQLHAYAVTRRDFLLASDDSLWAHESHGWLLSAASASPLAHRVGDIYYDATTETPLYFEAAAPPA